MNKLQLTMAVLAFIFAAGLIPISKMKMKGQGVRIWRVIALALLMLAALVAMFTPGLTNK